LCNLRPKMHSPILFTLGLATAFASLSTAHTVFTTLFVDGVNQGDGTCVRMSKDGNLATHPIAGFDNSDIVCGESPCVDAPSHSRFNN
jgi:hypothetical protein